MCVGLPTTLSSLIKNALCGNFLKNKEIEGSLSGCLFYWPWVVAHANTTSVLLKMNDTYRHKGMRRKLTQIVAEKGIQDHEVLRAVGQVPRHLFFDQAFLEHAYQDKAFPIGEGQTISQPYTVAFQSELLSVGAGDKVLEIGTGSGYQASILCEMGVKVYTIEYIEALYQRTRTFLPKLGYRPNFKCGDGTQGWPSQAPFDGIIVTAAAPKIPSTLIDQLKVGGRLIIPVGDQESQTMLRLTRKAGNQIVKEEFNQFAFVPLRGKDGWG